MESVQQRISESAADVQSTIGPQIQKAQERIEEINDQVIAFIRKNPGTCLLGALAVGFIIGRVASR